MCNCTYNTGGPLISTVIMVTICRTLAPNPSNYFKYVTVNQNAGCRLLGILQVHPRLILCPLLV